MALSKYIRDLLFRYECVIIPEFGGFLTKTISAQIDERSHTFYPPSKRLSFNSQLTENDGLLANYIASVDKVSYEKAISFIAIEVKEWKENLKIQNIILEGVGTFSLNEEKNILFEPDSKANFLTNAFGLTTIIAPAVNRRDYMNEEVVFESISDLVKRESIYSENQEQRLSPFFKFAASLALLLAIGYVFMNHIYKSNTSFKQLIALEAEKEASINKRIQEATFEINKALPAITLQVETKDADEVSVENNEEFTGEEANNKALATEKAEKLNTPEETSKIPNQTNDKSVGITTTKKYHIIGGAFRVPSNATKKVRQLKAKGYDAQIVGINKWQLTQVAFESFETREEALKALRKIRKTEEKAAWMLIK